MCILTNIIILFIIFFYAISLSVCRVIIITVFCRFDRLSCTTGSIIIIIKLLIIKACYGIGPEGGGSFVYKTRYNVSQDARKPLLRRL